MFGNRFIPTCDKRRRDEEGEEDEGRKGQREMTHCDKQRVKLDNSLKGPAVMNFHEVSFKNYRHGIVGVIFSSLKTLYSFVVLDMSKLNFMCKIGGMPL